MHFLIADDHKLVSDALAEYLKFLDPDLHVMQAATLGEAIDKIDESEYVDLILLDLRMPGMHGVEGLTSMRSRFPEIPVVMISGVAGHQEIADALDRGAAGFIPKDLSGPAMVKALELILTGETYVPFKFVSGGDLLQGSLGRHGQSSGGADNPLNKLTAREREVLSLVMKGRSNKEIARELGVKAVTAAFHLKGVCTKLGVSNRTQAAAAALRLGLSDMGAC